jgi:hypothetical protein
MIDSKENNYDWKSRLYLWIKRLVIVHFKYLVAASIFVFVFIFVFSFQLRYLSHTDADSARYMLSALIQSQAAIVAIVISLTLIAVELTASVYSPRVVYIFIKNLGMWILLGLYCTSIFYGLIVLRLVEGNKGKFVSQSVILPLGPISISLEFCIHLALLLGIITYVALLPYISNIMDLLKPENIIKRLSEDITGNKISNYIVKSSKGDETSAVDDPVQPIVDIIRVSIREHDFETTRWGLGELTKQMISVIDSNCEDDVSKTFCSHLQRVGKFAASMADEESTKEAIIHLEKFGKYSAKQDLKEATGQVVMSLRAVGEAAAENRLEDATMQVMQVALSLLAVCKAAMEKGKELEEVTLKVIGSLKAVGEVAAEEGLEEVTTQIALTLGDIGIIAVKNKLKVAKEQAIKALLAAGTVTVEKELEAAARQAASSLAVLTILSKENVKKTIQEYESKLKETDRSSFQKFKKLYEQEFEK